MLALGAALAGLVRGGDIVALAGDLGAGKTTFVRGVVGALTGNDPVSSPTFTFQNTYEAPALTFSIEHLDLYRLDDPAELNELGLEEAFGPSRLTLIEWPEKGSDLIGTPAWSVTIEGSGDSARTVTIERGPPRPGDRDG